MGEPPISHTRGRDPAGSLIGLTTGRACMQPQTSQGSFEASFSIACRSASRVSVVQHRASFECQVVVPRMVLGLAGTQVLDSALLDIINYRLESREAKLKQLNWDNDGKFGNKQQQTPTRRQVEVGAEKDARVLQYVNLRASRLSPREVRDAEDTWFKKRQSDWVRTHSTSQEPQISMTKERHAALKEAFEMMDLDGNGTIDYQELSALMKSLGQSSEQVHAALSAGDLDGSGTLDFPEFAAMMIKSMEGDGRRAAREAGNSFPFTLVVDSHRITHTIDSLFSKEISRFPDPKLLERERRYQVERRRRRGRTPDNRDGAKERSAKEQQTPRSSEDYGIYTPAGTPRGGAKRLSIPPWVGHSAAAGQMNNSGAASARAAIRVGERTRLLPRGPTPFTGTVASVSLPASPRHLPPTSSPRASALRLQLGAGAPAPGPAPMPAERQPSAAAPLPDIAPASS